MRNTTIVGNLATDIELAFTTSGVPWARFTIAVTPRRMNNNTGKWEDSDSHFFKCVAWRDMAERLSESVEKGDRVIVTGNLEVNSWETNEGDKRSETRVNVTDGGPSVRWRVATVNRVDTRTNSASPAGPPADRGGGSRPTRSRPTRGGNVSGQGW